MHRSRKRLLSASPVPGPGSEQPLHASHEDNPSLADNSSSYSTAGTPFDNQGSSSSSAMSTASGDALPASVSGTAEQQLSPSTPRKKMKLRANQGGNGQSDVTAVPSVPHERRSNGSPVRRNKVNNDLEVIRIQSLPNLPGYVVLFVQNPTTGGAGIVKLPKGQVPSEVMELLTRADGSKVALPVRNLSIEGTFYVVNKNSRENGQFFSLEAAETKFKRKEGSVAEASVAERQEDYFRNVPVITVELLQNGNPGTATPYVFRAFGILLDRYECNSINQKLTTTYDILIVVDGKPTVLPFVIRGTCPQHKDALNLAFDNRFYVELTNFSLVFWNGERHHSRRSLSASLAELSVVYLFTEDGKKSVGGWSSPFDEANITVLKATLAQVEEGKFPEIPSANGAMSTQRDLENIASHVSTQANGTTGFANNVPVRVDVREVNQFFHAGCANNPSHDVQIVNDSEHCPTFKCDMGCINMNAVLMKDAKILQGWNCDDNRPLELGGNPTSGISIRNMPVDPRTRKQYYMTMMDAMSRNVFNVPLANAANTKETDLSELEKDLEDVAILADLKITKGHNGRLYTNIQAMRPIEYKPVEIRGPYAQEAAATAAGSRDIDAFPGNNISLLDMC